MRSFLQQCVRLRHPLINVAFYLLLPLVLVGLFLSDENYANPGTLLRGYVSLFTTCLSIGLFHTLYFWSTHARVRRWLHHPPVWFVYHGLSVLVGTRLGIELTARLHALHYGPQAAEGLRDDLTPSAYVVSAIIIATVAVVLTIQSSRQAAEQRELAARQEAVRAQLAALQARTDPHFLFNSLNTVASLIEEDPRKAEEAVERLSSMFRYTLEGSRRSLVPLREELAMVRAYLENESLRFGDRLRFTTEVDDGAGDFAVPPLVLQPLVENAVLHGISRRREGGSVRVAATMGEAGLCLTVEDDGPGMVSQSNGSGGTLRELRERLRLMYDSDCHFEHGPTNSGYRVVIQLPRMDEA